MNTIQFLGMLATLGGFIIALTNNINKFSNTITRLDTTVNNLEKMVQELKEDNHKSHARLFNKTEEQEERLIDHENRINNLENK
ncbi:hypothetical protein [uncultured Anaerofustis sp.]|uniref:hypothetical protein n=1 Tax=uncultured Anaerofustis sp. TaxID=904996 RepID=UPI0025E33762|nr:hypothetical protein [uncultured Anaerofustis sp.]